MEIGMPTKWLFAENIEGRKLVGEFTGTNKVKTKKGELEAAIFVCSEAEYQIAPFNLVCETKFEVKGQKAELTQDSDNKKNIRVKLL